VKKKIKLFCWWLSLFLLFVLLHNAVYGLLGIEEPVFFLLALFSGLVLAVFLISSLFQFGREKLKGAVKNFR